MNILRKRMKNYYKELNKLKNKYEILSDPKARNKLNKKMIDTDN